ncbi:nitrile hydratase accessory protein [Natronococcus pandeyae]|uniref:Nitrile hydratase accessory protein n=1 Tax=Natronococcus pandeyae TaxID=2055836 RepID=A0A8J8TSL0_9EURY|nr:nitrile hydratase accessory protein [Natronococcus pandeyae]TYL38662.1 nitrile hydratase accessory protein [Natronococcus pandeyae]
MTADGPPASRLAALKDDEDAPVFHAPWQARAFAVAVALSDEGTYEWTAFQKRLAAEIEQVDEAAVPADGEASEAAYYRRWVAALERLLLADGVLENAELTERTREFAEGERDASEWIDGERDHGDHSHDGYDR